MFEHLRKIPAKDKNILRFSEVSNAWRSKITGYFSEARRTSEQAEANPQAEFSEYVIEARPGMPEYRTKEDRPRPCLVFRATLFF